MTRTFRYRSFAGGLALTSGLLAYGPTAGRAQAYPTEPLDLVASWDELESVASVDPAAVRWLRANLSEEEGKRLFSLVHALAEPGGTEELVGYFRADPSYAYLQAWPELRDDVDSELAALQELARAPTPGLLAEALHIARIRTAIGKQYAALPWYRAGFVGGELNVPSAPAAPHRFELVLDFGPALALLDLLGEPKEGLHDIERRLQPHDEVFSALVRHRGQSFYPEPLTRDALNLSLQRARSDTPMAVLYRFAFPQGLFHFAEVRERLGAYRALVRSLDGSRDRIEDHIASRIVPFMPEGLHFSRTVHFLFGDGADGWVSDGVAAIDLEFLKDDFDPLLGVLTHETFHALQAEARTRPWPEYEDPRQERLAGVLENIFQEGTANFIAAAQQRTAVERARMAREGHRLLEELHGTLLADPLDESRLEELRNQGVQGAGPFYWLGGQMTEVIVESMGPEALASSLEQGGVHFFDLYLEASRAAGEDALRFGSELEASIRDLRAL